MLRAFSSASAHEHCTRLVNAGSLPRLCEDVQCSETSQIRAFPIALLYFLSCLLQCLHANANRALQVPRALTVAGSDSGGGAGIQADLKTFQARGVFGMSAIAALTAQNTQGVRGIHVPPASFLKDQIGAVLEDVGTVVLKTGMLPNFEVCVHFALELGQGPVQHVIAPALRAMVLWKKGYACAHIYMPVHLCMTTSVSACFY